MEVIKLKSALLRMFKKIINITGSLYNYKSILLRFIFASIIGISFSTIIIYSTMGFDSVYSLKAIFYVRISCIYILACEGIVFIYYILDKLYSSPNLFFKRIRRQFIYSSIWCVSIYIISFFIYSNEIKSKENGTNLFMLFLAFGALFIFIMVIDLLSYRVFSSYKRSVKKVESIKRENLRQAYLTLRNQINPHFLYNSLTILTHEIEDNPEQSIVFSQKLAYIYRYISESKNNIIIELEKEINFVKDYIFIQQIRFGEALIFNVDEISNKDIAYVPPISIQLLVENAINHNTLNTKSPLSIEIYFEGEMVCIKNNVQKNKSPYSKKSGLTNLKNRYIYLTDSKVSIYHDSEYFLVKIPMIKNKNYEIR